MDQELVRFRKAAGQENHGRDVGRRYSAALQRQAVRYWLARQSEGDGLREVAGALGVAPWSLYRWTQESKKRSRFAPVQVVAPAPPRSVPEIVIVIRADGPRIEGLDVEAAARLLALLR